MLDHRNPFRRGYRSLTIRRLLCITYEDDLPPGYLPLHATQAHLSDSKVLYMPCVFCKEYALVTEDQDISEQLAESCPRDGIVRTVIYQITGKIGNAHAHVGDTYSAESANLTVTHLTFQTGFYSRCWEINTCHLASDAVRYLERLADTGSSSGRWFEAFRLPESHALGCKLIATPWNDEHLRDVDGQTADNLRREHHDAGVPASLVDVLHQAGQADVRMLIFDPDASILTGLPVFDH
ncbi:Uncharacterised protein [Burkholderia pseudomallei]|uniref:DUF5983 family protein n=1 Tax=Burkholderia pseudomallei TaxID=28450 RepID=UPI0005DD8492|nr:hypothetical protein [Burkholderia pseudomallei]CFV69524.1 Uncharacterised protein [Burkholderia pseudomallei]